MLQSNSRVYILYCIQTNQGVTPNRWTQLGNKATTQQGGERTRPENTCKQSKHECLGKT